jgi:hypothetical protein
VQLDLGDRLMRTKLIVDAIILAIFIIACICTVISFVIQEDYETLESKSLVITDSEQWFHEKLGKWNLLIVTYEKENQRNGQAFIVKTIQIIQTEGYQTFRNNGEWIHDGERVAISNVHDSNFTVDILDQHYIVGSLENLSYNILFGNDTSVIATFTFDSNIFNNCTQAWKSDDLKLDLVLND